MHRSLLAALLLAPAAISAQAFWPDEGPRTWAPRPTEAAITANDLRTRLYQFADDSMLGREAGTWGNIKATDYIAAEFKRLGLIPAGENGGYFQDVGYGPSGFDSTTLALTLPNGRAEPRTAWVPLPPGMAGIANPNFDGRGVATVFGGRWGDTTAALDPATIAGKAVVFLPPAENPGRFFQVSDPRAAGARLVLIAGLDAAPANLITFALNTRNALHTEFAAAAPAGVALTEAAAASLFDAPLPSLAVGTAGRPVTGHWTYQQGSTEYPVRNVLAILPGADPALRGQYVVIGAHNDHVGSAQRPVDHDSLRAFNTVMRPQGANDRVALDAVTPAQWAAINALIAKARAMRPPRPDSIFNGADDDGSGSMVLLEIAERMASGERPLRSVLFNSHAAEEKGLLGSRWWTWHPTVPLDSVVAAHNMDMVGKGRVTDVKFGGPHSVQMLGSRRVSAEFGDLIDSLNAVRDEPMVIDYSWDRTNRLNRFCRSDQVNYIRAGIPTTYFSTGYSRDYHQLTDEPQYINYELSARVARFLHDIASTIANRPERLAILPVEEQDPQARCGG